MGFGFEFGMVDPTNTTERNIVPLAKYPSILQGDNDGLRSNFAAAEEAVAKLGSIMIAPRPNTQGSHGHAPLGPMTSAQDLLGEDDESMSQKRKAASDLDDLGDETDDKKGRGKKKHLTNERREERNAREKERSLKITHQIHELRTLLSAGGVIVPKGTKSTILTEVANYIRLLQQHHYRSEMEKAQLVQEIQRIGKGEIGQKAAAAIRHVAAQNGVYAEGNFGKMPTNGTAAVGETEAQSPIKGEDGVISETIQEREYRCVFNSCSVGMAIATMGGSFIDCNQAFTQLSSYTKQELCAMTIFNLTSRVDLQGAFDMMSQLISPKSETSDDVQGTKLPSPVVLRSSIKRRIDLGLSVSLIRGDDGVVKYFSVTLVKIPSSPTGSSRPVPVIADPASPSNMDMQPPATPQHALSTVVPQSQHTLSTAIQQPQHTMRAIVQQPEHALSSAVRQLQHTLSSTVQQPQHTLSSTVQQPQQTPSTGVQQPIKQQFQAFSGPAYTAG